MTNLYIRNLYIRLGVGFIMALTLSILPMPEYLSALRPPWILLFILYIEYFTPHIFKLTVLIVLGLLLDVLNSAVIGEHCFALILVTWIASTKSRRFRFFSLIQQICLISILCFFYEETLTFINALLGLNYSFLTPLITATAILFVWPWIHLLADTLLLNR